MAPAIICVASSWKKNTSPECWSFPAGEAPTPKPVGSGLKTIVYMPEKQEPELMYKLFDGVVGSMDELVKAI